ncbi:hypothetical protein JDS91_30785 [Bacillus cereus]|uniref:hypothetical protein n=1 Tax=Bacillus cereus group TaxID=86661 RepID=UPI0018F3C002|nr:hypothetical protein [Bacillus cereus]
MKNIFDFFNQGWVGSFIGILGIVIALITTLIASKAKKRLVYQCKSLKVIGTDSITPNEIEITYKGKKVPRVIMTKITIWNVGKETINGSDIVNDDNLRLEIDKNEEIISLNIINKTRDVNKFTSFLDAKSNNTAILTFDYLDPNDGVTLEILHTDWKWNPKIKGSIKGLPKGLLNWSNGNSAIPYKNERKSRLIKILLDPYNSKSISILAAIAGGFLITVGIFHKEIESFLKLSEYNEVNIQTAFMIAGVIYMIPLIFELINIRKKPPKKLDSDINYENTTIKKDNKKIS